MTSGAQEDLRGLLAPIPRHRVRWYALAIGAALLLAQTLFWYVQVRPFYFPNGDEFPLLVHSTRVFGAHPQEWVLRGFADYFRPYPDLAIVGSEFLRPLDNLCFYLCSLVFGRQWADYLLLNYTLAACVTAVAFALAAGVLRLPRWAVTLVTVGAAASPAYNYQFFYRPSFAFDYLAALWALLCLASLVHRRWVLAWMCVLCAVLSKETGYYTAVSAFAFVLLCHRTSPHLRRWLVAASYLLPLGVMQALRSHAFHRTTGVYVLHGLTGRELVRNVIVGLTNWPYRLPGEQHIFALSLRNMASLLLSGVLWALLVSIGVSLWRQHASGHWTANAATRTALLLFLLGSCCFPIALVLPVRFGASTYPLLLLTLAALLPSLPRTSRVWQLGLCSLIAVVLANLAALPDSFRTQTLREHREMWELARNLIGSLHGDTHGVRFLVGDVTAGFATPEDVARFADSPGRVVPVIGFHQGSCKAPASVVAIPGQGGVALQLSAPCGGLYQLVWTERPDGDPGERLRRETAAATILYRGATASQMPGSYGWQAVSIDLIPRGEDFVVLSPDLQSGQYRQIAGRP